MQRCRKEYSSRRFVRAGGFTLIELVAVMVVVGVMAAVAVPTLNSMDDKRAGIAAGALLKDLSFARQRAVATGTPTWVVFDVDAETWSVMAEDPDNPGRLSATVITDPATGKPFTQQLGVDSLVGTELVSAVIDGDVEIGFDWLGRPLNATESPLISTGVITITGNHQVQITLDTGNVTYAAP